MGSPAAAGPGTDVVMPQMGESITEGTITKWLKKVGDTVQRDEPIFEISTDKVDAEIPSPIAGVLSEIKVPEGSTVQINTVVAVIGGAAGAPAAKAAAPAAPAPAALLPLQRLHPPLPRARRSARRRWSARLRRITTSICTRSPAPELRAALRRATSSDSSRAAPSLLHLQLQLPAGREAAKLLRLHSRCRASWFR